MLILSVSSVTSTKRRFCPYPTDNKSAYFPHNPRRVSLQSGGSPVKPSIHPSAAAAPAAPPPLSPFRTPRRPTSPSVCPSLIENKFFCVFFCLMHPGAEWTEAFLVLGRRPQSAGEATNPQQLLSSLTSPGQTESTKEALTPESNTVTQNLEKQPRGRTTGGLRRSQS